MSILKYKTADSLLADIMVDFRTYAQENMIEPQELMRVIQYVTADIGLRIYRTKEALLEITSHKTRLPLDFHVFNYGLMCGEHSICVVRPGGVQTVELPLGQTYRDMPQVNACAVNECPVYSCDNCGRCGECTPGIVVVPGYNPLRPLGDPCIRPRVFMDCKGDAFELVQILQTETRRYKYMMPLKLVSSSVEVSEICPNRHVHCHDEINIRDGFLFTNFSCGKVYLNYEGALEDDDGNLLVPDHPIISVYYEYKLKHRILENLWINGEEVQQKLGYVSDQLRKSRIEALNVARTPDFAELKELWVSNRKAFNFRYVDMFSHLNWLVPGRGRTR